MKPFTDSAGRTWTIAMTIDSVKRVRDLLDINLVEPEAGEPPLITRLATDVILLCDTIYCMVKPQADKLNVTDAEFGAALGGDAILNATVAFYQELSDFFLASGRPDRSKAIAAQQKMIQLAVERVKQAIEAINPEAQVAQTFGS
jgi:hypothetical protein